MPDGAGIWLSADTEISPGQFPHVGEYVRGTRAALTASGVVLSSARARTVQVSLTRDGPRS